MTTLLTRARREGLLRTGLLVGGPLVVLLVAAGRVPVPMVLATAAAVGAVLAWAVRHHGLPALAAGTALVAVVPFYDGRYVVGAIGVTPMTAVALLLLPAAALAARHVRVGALDVAFGLMLLLRAAALLLNAPGGPGAVANLVLSTALPYVVFRALTLPERAPTVLAAAVVGTAVPLALLGVFERNGLENPFFTLLPAEYEAAQWARPELRSGGIRAEASFGHPIAFGMYLALAFVLAVALALTVRRLATRLALFAGCAVLLLGLTATLSRGPLLVAAVGTVAWLLATRRTDVLRLGAAAAVLTVAVVATPVLGTLQGLWASSSGDTSEARSAEYRLVVLEVVLDPDQFSLLGRLSEGEGVTAAVAARTGLKSIDSEYAVVFLTNGLLAMLALVGLFVLVAAAVVRPGLDAVERAWVAGLAASYLNLATVALLTQHEELFWGATALVAAVLQRRGARTPA